VRRGKKVPVAGVDRDDAVEQDEDRADRL